MKTSSNISTRKLVIGSAAITVLAAVIFFFVFFQVNTVEIMGSEHYSEDELKEKILKGPLTSNSVLAPLFYAKDAAEDLPYIESFNVRRSGRNKLIISVKEKNVVGCIPYLDSYVYFDRNGYFVEGSKTRDTKVAFFDGIQVKKVVMEEKLPIKEMVLNTATALSTIFSKNDMVPDHILFDDDYEISLMYGDITVQLGKDQYLEDKMTRAIAILPELSGQKGILHMESISRSSKVVTFETEEEEITAENWTGGYDENGDYTGDGEYDENGKYVGPKPATALDTALERWVGGYDEEGDYTGSGEYDADLNYVGPAPTQETLDAFGDWTGGYNESGGFDGVSEYDADGNYVGPRPDETETSENTEDSDGSEDEEATGDYSENDSESDDSGEEYVAYEEEEQSADGE
ncbi:MAG: FtsQ-type POTRA domain-containing protein [Eubacteriales bacterium]|nr:FtsQ-type POTRA domain-containing protein [Eubacteriales bacterium]